MLRNVGIGLVAGAAGTAALNITTGLGIGAGYGALRSRLDSVPIYAGGPGLGLAAMVGSDAPAAVRNVTDPKSWGQMRGSRISSRIRSMES